MPVEGNPVVLADDLSGAHISAARLACMGLRPRVLWDLHAVGHPNDNDALAVDMRTRDWLGDPRDLARSWTQAVMGAGAGWLELRIDSTLRGATSEELVGVLEALGDEPVVCVSAAFPSSDRLTVNGMQLADGRPIGEVGRAVFGERPSAIVPVSVLEQGADAALAAVDGLLTGGTHRLVFDATSEEHLQMFAQVIDRLRDDGYTVVTVSPGAWLRYAVPSPFTLVVIGSPTPANARQLDVLGTQPGTMVLSLGDSLGQGKGMPSGLARARTVVVHSFDGPHDRERAAVSLSAAAQSVLDGLAGRACLGIVATGGHTAAHLAEGLGATSLVALSEPEPLCAKGVLVGGAWDGLPFITKGGRIGGPDTLARLHVAVG